jgi:hypothetical protein
MKILMLRITVLNFCVSIFFKWTRGNLVITHVWCEYESYCNDLISVSASDSGGDSVAMAGAVILSAVSTIQVQ